MAACKRLRKVLTTTGCIVAGLGLLFLIKGFVCCPCVDGGSSAAPSPGPDGGDSSAGPGGCDPPDGFCIPLSRRARYAVAFLLGVLTQWVANALSGDPLATDDEEEAAAGAAKKVGYVAIDDVDGDVEAGDDGGKN